MKINIAQACLIDFVLFDDTGAVFPSLDDGFTVEISKNGGAFAAGTGTNAEIGDGWYSYELTASETDTAGPLAVKITGSGAVQQNLLYEVSGVAWTGTGGTNILTATEAAYVLRCADDEPLMLTLLPQVDAYIKMATGRDWTADATIRPEAKAAARILIVRWHEDPGSLAASPSLGFGQQAALLQLGVLALELEGAGVPDEPLRLVSSLPAIYLPNVYNFNWFNGTLRTGWPWAMPFGWPRRMPYGWPGITAPKLAVKANLVLIFNHEMDTSATSAITLQTEAGVSTAVSNSLDVTKKILTIHPTSDLAAATNYVLTITAAADIYGLTLTDKLYFTTA